MASKTSEDETIVVLVDTGVFVAAADRDETEHRPCGELLRTRHGLMVTASVIPEAAWIIEARFGPAA